MISFLLSLNKKHGNYIYKSTSMLVAVGIGIWGFEVQNIFPSGALPPNQKWVFRLLLSLLSVSTYFATLLFMTLYHYKKDVDKYDAKLNPPTTFYEVNQTFINPSTDEKIETVKSAPPTSPQRSFPGPRIPDSKTFQQEDHIGPKPIEAAAVSSEPGPDDYHAPRRTFFPEINRPKRR